MKLTLIREAPDEKSTSGQLFINGNYFCDTLEDLDRGLKNDMPLAQIQLIKVPKMTAIPTGTYMVAYTFSNRFQKYLPLLIAVPGFDGIRIHRGNTDEDTEGCILLGIRTAEDFIAHSKDEFDSFMVTFKAAIDRNEDITIDIVRKSEQLAA
jgi:hypothetical protein